MPRKKIIPFHDAPARGANDEDFDRRAIADLIAECDLPRSLTTPDPFWRIVDAEGTALTTATTIHVALFGIRAKGRADNTARDEWLALAAIALDAEAA